MSWSPHLDVQCVTLDGLVKETDRWEEDAQFTALVTRQSRFVFRLAYAVVRNAYDAEDVVQGTFLKLYRTGAWKRMQDEKAFLARVTWHLALESRAAQSKVVGLTDSLFSLADSPEAQAVQADTHRLVHALVDALPEELRLPLALSTLDELTSGEIGQIMNLPEGTVRSRVARARHILKTKLEQVLGVRHDRKQ